MPFRRIAGVWCLAAVLALADTLPSQAFSIDLGKVVSNIGNIAKAIAKLPNPITTPIQIITGNQNPLNVKDYIKQQGQALGSIADSTRNITNVPYDAAGAAVSEIAGDKARIVFEFATGMDRLQREFAFTAAQAAGGILQGQDPLISLAMPLSAAIRDAHSKFEAQAQPFPDSVKAVLGQIIPQDILARARYTVGDIKISVPSVIIVGGKLFGDDMAVTLDDVIVFSRQPDFNQIGDLSWVAHELFHTKQYRDWGVDQFSFNYLKNWRAVEDQAKAAESYARSFLTQVANNQPIHPQITYQSAFAYVPAAQTIQTPLGPTTVMTDASQQTPGQPNGALVQPVFRNQLGQAFIEACIINGEKILVAQDQTIIAPMRGYIPFGQRHKPGANPACHHDLVFPGGPLCVTEVPMPGGQWYYPVMTGGGQIGYCSGCAGGESWCR